MLFYLVEKTLFNYAESPMNLSFSQSENSGQSDTLKSVGILVPFCIIKMLHSRYLLLGQTLLLSFTFGHPKEDVFGTPAIDFVQTADK